MQPAWDSNDFQALCHQCFLWLCVKSTLREQGSALDSVFVQGNWGSGERGIESVDGRVGFEPRYVYLTVQAGR